jgi:tol-pal system protein YbgF
MILEKVFLMLELRLFNYYKNPVMQKTLSIFILILFTLSLYHYNYAIAGNNFDSSYQPSEEYLSSLEHRISELEEEVRDLKTRLDDFEYEKRKIIDQQHKNFDLLSNEIKTLTKQLTSLTAQNEASIQEFGVGKSESPFTKDSTNSPLNESIEPFYQKYKNTQGLPLPNPENTRFVEEEYKMALDLFKEAKYYEAELAFKNFINKYNKHPLATNAYYWLAEGFFIRNKFDEAMANYLKCYRSNPTGDKASDSLFKLSKSLAAVNKLSEACMTLYKLTKEFPSLPLELSKQVDDEKLRIGCNN